RSPRRALLTPELPRSRLDDTTRAAAQIYSRGAMSYELVPAPPSLAEYLALRRSSGLSPKTDAQGRGAIENSWAFCHVRDDRGTAVAMGRALGDGGWYFHIADMATDPEHQRR